MDIKNEEEFKVELVESTEEDDKKINIHLEQLSTLEEIQKSHLDIEEEEAANDELLDKISTLDQNQFVYEVMAFSCFRVRKRS
ncbi:hypothetical protein Avbf_16200 [Armadillidium vulgare]|nr:hypothetical protein Avbf_16200 [Armadillidium vulgare]